MLHTTDPQQFRLAKACMQGETRVGTIQGSQDPPEPLRRQSQLQLTEWSPGHTGSPRSGEGPDHPSVARTHGGAYKSRAEGSRLGGSHASGGGPKLEGSQPQQSQAGTTEGGAPQRRGPQGPTRQQQEGDQ